MALRPSEEDGLAPRQRQWLYVQAKMAASHFGKNNAQNVKYLIVKAENIFFDKIFDLILSIEILILWIKPILCRTPELC